MVWGSLFLLAKQGQEQISPNRVPILKPISVHVRVSVLFSDAVTEPLCLIFGQGENNFSHFTGESEPSFCLHFVEAEYCPCLALGLDLDGELAMR